MTVETATALPRVLLISDPGYGHFDIGGVTTHWRLAAWQTQPLRAVLAPALVACGLGVSGSWDDAGELPRLPPYVYVRNDDDALSLGVEPDGTKHRVGNASAVAIRDALATAFYGRPHYADTPPIPLSGPDVEPLPHEPTPAAKIG